MGWKEGRGTLIPRTTPGIRSVAFIQAPSHLHDTSPHVVPCPTPMMRLALSVRTQLTQPPLPYNQVYIINCNKNFHQIRTTVHWSRGLVVWFSLRVFLSILREVPGCKFKSYLRRNNILIKNSESRRDPHQTDFMSHFFLHSGNLATI